MKGFFRWFLTTLGYAVYAVAVILVLLWFLFPADSSLVWLQKKLNAASSSFVWEIKGLNRGFPFNIRLSDIKLSERDDKQTPILQFASLQLAPDMKGLAGLTSKIPFTYQLKTLDGTVKGDCQVSSNRSLVSCTGEMQNLQVGDLVELWKMTDRSGSGAVSGTFKYFGVGNNLLQGTLRAKLQVKDGTVSLRQKILGLDRIDFQSMTTSLNIKDRVASFENGQMESRLFKADFDGSLKLTGNMYTSAVNIRGKIEPRSELFGGLKNSASVSFIKGQLQDDKLSFIINGTLVEPGILFKGASGVIDGIIEGGVR